MAHTVLHIIGDLHQASPIELIAYSVAGPQVVEEIHTGCHLATHRRCG
jgi:hypothetical protein